MYIYIYIVKRNEFEIQWGSWTLLLQSDFLHALYTPARNDGVGTKMAISKPF